MGKQEVNMRAMNERPEGRGGKKIAVQNSKCQRGI